VPSKVPDFIEQNTPPDSPLFPTRHGNLGKWRLKSSEKALKNQGFFAVAKKRQERRALRFRQDSPPEALLRRYSGCKSPSPAQTASPGPSPGGLAPARPDRRTSGSSGRPAAPLRRSRACRRYKRCRQERSAIVPRLVQRSGRWV